MMKSFPLEKVYQIGDRVNKAVSKPKKIKNIPVISIGNLTTGGTGKTPAAIYFVKMLQEMHMKPAILTRGYGGTIYREGGILSDGKLMLLSERESGDEPYLLAVNLPGVPIAVGKNRYENGLKLARLFDIDVFVLDDGFQHYGLKREVDIVLIDATKPFGNGHVLPHGTLRESPEALKRSHIIIITKASLISGEKKIELIEEIKKSAGHDKIFESNHNPSLFVKLPVTYDFDSSMNWKTEKLQMIKNKKVWALSGIGNHQAFEKTLLSLGAAAVESISFRDHYRYTLKDVLGIIKRIGKDDYLITTEKDWIRLQYFREHFHALNRFYFLAINFGILKDEGTLINEMKEILNV
ncbi:MAG: tetraacyldisaccharide 4'-kinase [Spirochaetia bacterium]|nr:tetraacyldisaccharide 4'-kinase [Spirochaetia bacterium]